MGLPFRGAGYSTLLDSDTHTPDTTSASRVVDEVDSGSEGTEGLRGETIRGLSSYTDRHGKRERTDTEDWETGSGSGSQPSLRERESGGGGFSVSMGGESAVVEAIALTER